MMSREHTYSWNSNIEVITCTFKHQAYRKGSMKRSCLDGLLTLIHMKRSYLDGLLTLIHMKRSCLDGLLTLIHMPGKKNWCLCACLHGVSPETSTLCWTFLSLIPFAKPVWWPCFDYLKQLKWLLNHWVGIQDSIKSLIQFSLYFSCR